MWLAYELTHQSKWPSLVAAAQVLPTAFLSVWGGTLADRLPKRSVIAWTQTMLLLQALVLAALVLTGVALPWHLLAVSVASGVVLSVDLPARLAFLVDMVGRDDLPNAVALNSLLFNAARAVGPALGGLVLVALGPGPCFVLNAFSFLAVIFALGQMTVTGSSARPPGPDRTGPLRPFSIRSALAYVAAQPELAFLLLLAGIMSVFGWPFLSLLPKLAQSALGEAERGYSLMVTGTGCGALLAALLLASRRGQHPRSRYLPLGAALTAVAILGLSLAPTLALAIGCCAAAGAGLILFFATSQSIVQLSASEHNRGRIMGLWSMVCCAGQPLGNFVGGPSADWLGEPMVLRLQGVGCTTAVVLFLLSRAWNVRTTTVLKLPANSPPEAISPEVIEAGEPLRGGALPRSVALKETSR
jgi:MFS family permease